MSSHTLFRDTFLGEIIRTLSNNRLLQYDDEVDKDNYYTNRYSKDGTLYKHIKQLYNDKQNKLQQLKKQRDQNNNKNINNTIIDIDNNNDVASTRSNSVIIEHDDISEHDHNLKHISNSNNNSTSDSDSNKLNNNDTDNDNDINTNNKLDEQIEQLESDVQKYDPNRVDFEGDLDIDHDKYISYDNLNPMTWSLGKKCFVTFCICFLTFSIYIGSSIYSPGEQSLMKNFNDNLFQATLGLSLFVLGYSTGPMILSPLSEIPALGRNNIYIITLAIFVALQAPTVCNTVIVFICILCM